MSAFDYQGYELLSGVLPMDKVGRLRDALAETPLEQEAGMMNADKKLPIVQELVHDPELLRIAEQYLTGIVSVVRVRLFDKTDALNGSADWHQERTVTLNNKVEMEEWGPWSVKEGIHHVQPPMEVLDNMVTLRVHLDPANAESGCLRLIPHSHNAGLMSAGEIERYAATHESTDCIAEAGDILAMRPHMLHALRKGSKPSSQRVIHIDYCGYKLPAGLDWA